MRIFHVRRSLVAVLCGLVVVAACGTGSDTGAGADDVPMTQRAIAAVALEHLPDDTTSRTATATSGDDDPQDSLGADLRYSRDGGLLRVVVSSPDEKDPCPDEVLDGCVEREVDGGTLVLTWQEEEPEEDPGQVSVLLRRRDATISTSWSGDVITGDPREQDLTISVAAMEDVVQDQRLGLTTSQATIDEGASLDDWDGGEPDPAANDRVPSTGDSLISAYWSARGGYGAFGDRQASPLTAELGAGAVGGRFSAQENTPRPARTIDVLAAPRPPDWLADDPCATERFAGRCVAESRGRYFAWVPGSADAGGEVWMFAIRADDFVAVRTSGFRVPDDEEAARVKADWYAVDSFLLRDTVGVETDREMLDLDFG